MATSRLLKREHGTLIVSSLERDRPLLEQRTVQCCHCGGHYAVRPGSGRIRGYCYRCAGPICGPGCAECVPTEQLLENYEQGRPLDWRRITVAVAAAGTILLPPGVTREG